VFKAEYGQENVVPIETNGRMCTYFTAEAYSNGATPDNVRTVELYDHAHVMTIADRYRLAVINAAITTPALGSSGNAFDFKNKLLIKGTAVHRVRNMTNENITVEAYFCKARHNITLKGAAATVNIYNFLSVGFANNGLDTANINPTTNLTMGFARYTPFNSWDFTKNFKVYKKKVLRLSPSAISVVKISSGTKWIRPADWVYLDGTVNTSTSFSGLNRIYSNCVPQKFVLFKMTSNPAGFGAEQSGYSRRTQETTPTIVMDTTFTYKAKQDVHMQSTDVEIEVLGITDPTTATHPATIMEDSNVVAGQATDAF